MTGHLWRLFEDYLARQPFPPSQRRVAAKLDMSPTAFGNWRDRLSKMPDAQNLARFAELINVPYVRVVDAALHDAGYLPRPKVEPLDGPATKVQLAVEIDLDEPAAARDIEGPSRGQTRRAEHDLAGEPETDDAGDLEAR